MFNKSVVEKLKQYKTPFYYYDFQRLERTLQAIKKEASKYKYTVHYALKANSNPKILEYIASRNFGADCVSGNEIQRAVNTGFPRREIVFAGVGKTDEEIKLAIENEIFCFNVESIAEIEVINKIASEKNKAADIALRINPNVNANTHKYITTGLEENKFGISRWEFEKVLEKLEQLKNINLKGLHFHIGSQITDLTAFKNLCIRVNEIQEWFNNRNIKFKHINVGGGLGIDYANPEDEEKPNFKEFFGIFNKFLHLRKEQQLHFELGRAVVAQAGTLITKIIYIKEGVTTNFAIVDAGMSDLIRPALYQAYHKIENIESTKEKEKYDVVGPICESSDTFGKAVELPKSQRGELLAIRSAGAYGEIMASEYNLRKIAGKVYNINNHYTAD